MAVATVKSSTSLWIIGLKPLELALAQVDEVHLLMWKVHFVFEYNFIEKLQF